MTFSKCHNLGTAHALRDQADQSGTGSNKMPVWYCNDPRAGLKSSLTTMSVLAGYPAAGGVPAKTGFW
jgi:hypothetical protein